MPSVINTNVPSLNTQRNLSASQAALNVSIQRLSTGLRVNSAKDDAAGLAIAERMNAQVKGLTVAARNANDGVSLAQTAEGALGKVGEMIQRIRELAVQSSNATNSADDRKALQAEVAQLKDEIDRVANTTNFNGTKLLDGTFKAANFQVGADAGQTITVASIANTQLSAMGNVAIATATVDIADLTGFATDIAVGDVTINGHDIGAIGAAASEEERATQLVEAINRISGRTGVHAFIDGSDLKLVSDKDIVVDGDLDDDEVAGLANDTIDADGSTGAMSALDISTYEGAQLAIRQADEALKQINTSRASLGAVQSRFENAISNIQISMENTTAARSRIMDTDFAAETANLTRAQILQQAGNAMLSQANQLPQQVLSLLR